MTISKWTPIDILYSLAIGLAGIIASQIDAQGEYADVVKAWPWSEYVSFVSAVILVATFTVLSLKGVLDLHRGTRSTFYILMGLVMAIVMMT